MTTKNDDENFKIEAHKVWGNMCEIENDMREIKKLLK